MSKEKITKERRTRKIREPSKRKRAKIEKWDPKEGGYGLEALGDLRKDFRHGKSD